MWQDQIEHSIWYEIMDNTAESCKKIPGKQKFQGSSLGRGWCPLSYCLTPSQGPKTRKGCSNRVANIRPTPTLELIGDSKSYLKRIVHTQP